MLLRSFTTRFQLLLLERVLHWRRSLDVAMSVASLQPMSMHTAAPIPSLGAAMTLTVRVVRARAAPCWASKGSLRAMLRAPRAEVGLGVRLGLWEAKPFRATEPAAGLIPVSACPQ
jgi:hypothetical protein